MSDEPLTIEEWKRAFHRMAILAAWRDMQAPNVATGPNGEAWVPEAIDKWDVEANARAILDDERVCDYNRDNGYNWVLEQVLRV